MPVLDHKAPRTFFQIGGVKGQEERRGALAGAAIAGLDLQDRLHLIGQPGPDARDLQ